MSVSGFPANRQHDGLAHGSSTKMATMSGQSTMERLREAKRLLFLDAAPDSSHSRARSHSPSTNSPPRFRSGEVHGTAASPHVSPVPTSSVMDLRASLVGKCEPSSRVPTPNRHRPEMGPPQQLSPTHRLHDSSPGPHRPAVRTSDQIFSHMASLPAVPVTPIAGFAHRPCRSPSPMEPRMLHRPSRTLVGAHLGGDVHPMGEPHISPVTSRLGHP